MCKARSRNPSVGTRSPHATVLRPWSAGIGLLLLACVTVAPTFGQSQIDSETFTGPTVASNAEELPPGLALETFDQPMEIPLDQPIGHAAADLRHRLRLVPYWDHGLQLVSPDENFQLHAGGNLQWDSVWLVGSSGVLESGNNATSTGNSGASLIRRARFKFDGHIDRWFDYSIEYDLANSVNDNKDLASPTQDNLADSAFPCNVWIQLREVPWFGRVRIGNQVKPLGMTNNTYQGFLPFMERADNMDAFYGPFDEGFHPGISAAGASSSERIAWRYGIFRPLKNAFGIGIDEYEVIGRFTTSPGYDDDGQRVVHLGVGGSQGSLVNDEFRLRGRPLLRNGPGYAVPILVDTTTLAGSSQALVAPEFAAVFGSWTLQSEWAGQFFRTDLLPDASTAFFHGGYVQLLYFLTGETPNYDRREGVFGRVVPTCPLELGGTKRGCGAWQIGVRLGYLDLIDDTIDGGQVEDLTVGLNWFLNANMKIQGNYILEHREGPLGIGDGWFSGLGVRAACDF
jgi:phosphate-selective porin OprO/OprP